MTMNAIEMNSPIGTLTLVEDEGALIGVHMETAKKGTGYFSAAAGKAASAADGKVACPPFSPVLDQAKRQLDEYFAGKRETFDLPLEPRGTDFQRAVWKALLEIPFGETKSYAAIAKRIGRPAAVRAVGAANGSNPIALIIPCHRVIGANGSLTGYGGGIPRKQWLLRHENRQPSLTL